MMKRRVKQKKNDEAEGQAKRRGGKKKLCSQKERAEMMRPAALDMVDPLEAGEALGDWPSWEAWGWGWDCCWSGVSSAAAGADPRWWNGLGVASWRGGGTPEREESFSRDWEREVGGDEGEPAGLK